MRISIFAFGKLKTPGLREASDYYQKLLGGFVTIQEVELRPLAVPDKSPLTRKQIQEKEGQLLLEKISKQLVNRTAIYILDETGKTFSTQQWATMARDWEQSGTPELALCIGSSLGFSEAVRKASKGALALGPQTFPHELARVVLLEQLYRAWSVLRGHPYHNEGS